MSNIFLTTTSFTLNGMKQIEDGICPAPNTEQVRISLAQTADMLAGALLQSGMQVSFQLRLDITISLKHDEYLLEPWVSPKNAWWYQPYAAVAPELIDDHIAALPERIAAQMRAARPRFSNEGQNVITYNTLCDTLSNHERLRLEACIRRHKECAA